MKYCCIWWGGENLIFLSGGVNVIIPLLNGYFVSFLHTAFIFPSLDSPMIKGKCDNDDDDVMKGHDIHCSGMQT